MKPSRAGTDRSGWPMWKHRLVALAIFLACLGAWVGTALYRAHGVEAEARQRLGRLSERVRASLTTPGNPEPDVRADRRALLLNPFQKRPAVYLYLHGRRAAQLNF